MAKASGAAVAPAGVTTLRLSRRRRRRRRRHSRASNKLEAGHRRSARVAPPAAGSAIQLKLCPRRAGGRERGAWVWPPLQANCLPALTRAAVQPSRRLQVEWPPVNLARALAGCANKPAAASAHSAARNNGASNNNNKWPPLGRPVRSATAIGGRQKQTLCRGTDWRGRVGMFCVAPLSLVAARSLAAPRSLGRLPTRAWRCASWGCRACRQANGPPLEWKWRLQLVSPSCRVLRAGAAGAASLAANASTKHNDFSLGCV